MTEVQSRKLVVIRHALDAIEECLRRGTMVDVDIEAMIVGRGYQDYVTAEEAHDAIEENLIGAFHL